MPQWLYRTATSMVMVYLSGFLVHPAAFAAPKKKSKKIDSDQKSELQPERRTVPLIPFNVTSTPSVWTKRGYVDFGLGQGKSTADQVTNTSTLGLFSANIPLTQKLQGVVRTTGVRSEDDSSQLVTGTVYGVQGHYGLAWRASRNLYAGIAIRHNGLTYSGKFETDVLSSVNAVATSFSVNSSHLSPAFGLQYQSQKLQAALGYDSATEGSGGELQLRNRLWFQSAVYGIFDFSTESNSNDDSDDQTDSLGVGIGHAIAGLNGEIVYETGESSEDAKSSSDNSERETKSGFKVRGRYGIDGNQSIGLILELYDTETTTIRESSDPTKSNSKSQVVALDWGIKL